MEKLLIWLAFFLPERKGECVSSFFSDLSLPLWKGGRTLHKEDFFEGEEKTLGTYSLLGKFNLNWKKEKVEDSRKSGFFPISSRE